MIHAHSSARKHCCMPYQMIEQLRSRRGEKVAPFATAENVVGMSVLAGPFFIMNELPMLVRIVLILFGATLGYLITQESRGMMFCERVLWRLRGEFRLLLRGRTLAPSDLAGTRRAVIQHRAVARGGIVQKSRQHKVATLSTAVIQKRAHIVSRRNNVLDDSSAPSPTP